VKHSAAPALPAETMVRLERFAALLERWNRRINLVAPRDLPNLWTRHIEDSLQLAPLIPPGAAVTDLGSGAGFPGLILAIATDSPVTLIESDTRKASFLREAARETGARATVVNARIEAAVVPPAPVITARALASLPQLLDWAVPHLQPGGFCLFLKGRKVDGELTDAAARWHMTVARTPSRTDPDGVILALSHIRRIGLHQGPPVA
jgi:16S rRNA (guanine527-N7)-methyltransferase